MTCLRVSRVFFKAAGKLLYSYVIIDTETDVDGLFLGSDIVNKRISGSESRSEPKRTNLKRQLLQMTKTVVVRAHECPQGRSARAERSKWARAASNVERVIIVPPHDFMLTSALCDEDGGSRECPIVKGFNKCKSATIHNIQVDGPEDGPLELFPSLLKHLEQVTLVIPPTAFYIHKRFPPISGQPADLSYATKHIKSIRVIVGIDAFDLLEQSMDLGGNAQLCQLPPLVVFLAEMIFLQAAEFEIYVLHDFDGLFEPDTFKTDLLAHIETERGRVIQWQQREGKPTEETVAWQPKILHVGNDEDYFIGRRDLSAELDDMWAFAFEDDLHFKLLEERARAEATGTFKHRSFYCEGADNWQLARLRASSREAASAGIGNEFPNTHHDHIYRHPER